MPTCALVKSYTARSSELSNEALLQEAYALMPAARQTRIKSFRTEQGKQQGIAAWLLLLYALSKEGIPIPPEDAWQFTGKGKPALPGGPHFNLSHSGDCVLCSLCHEAEVGCDLERIREWKPQLAKFCMQEQEFKAMESLENARERAHAFTRSWTLKESYMKARGIGLGLDPKSFALRFTTDNKPRLEDSIQPSCAFQEYDLGEEYCCSACALASKVQFGPLVHRELAEALKCVGELRA